jgi:hypothetical protein
VTTAPPALARCLIRGCPVRYRHGDNRLCAWHGAEDTSVNLTTRANGFGVTMAAFDGDQHGAEDKQAQDSSTLTDHHEHLDITNIYR